MKCPKCQSENRDEIKFCEQCGTKMEMECPNCKAKIPLGKKFCGECFREIPAGEKIVIIDVLGNPAYMPIGWFLKSKGYNDVMMLKGGMNAWQKERLPLEK